MAGPANPLLPPGGGQKQPIFPTLVGLVSAVVFTVVVFLLREQALVRLNLVPKRLALSEAFLWSVLVVAGALGVSLAAARRRGIAIWVLLAVLVGAVAVGTGTAQQALNMYRALPTLAKGIGMATIWVVGTLLLAWAGNASGHYRYFIGAGVLNGVILSALLVPLVSGEFRAGLVAFMSGLAVDNIAAKDTAVRKAIGAINAWIADMANHIAGLDPSNASRHAFLVTAVSYFFWSAILLTVASFVIVTISSGIVSTANAPAPAPSSSPTPVPSPS